MKKIILFGLAVIMTANFVQAQQSAFTKGDNVVGLGIGLGGNIYSGSGWGYAGISKMPLIFANYEHCIVDNLFDAKSSIGIGAMAGFTSSKWGDVRWTDIIIGARGGFHYTFVSKLDTYGGLMLGYDIRSVKSTVSSDVYKSPNDFAWSLYVGARYYFTESIGAFAEVGYGVSILNVGVALKF